MRLLKRNKVWIGVINCTNYWVWTRKSCRRRIILITVNSGITSLETGSGRTVCWHLREGKTERAIFRIQGLCTKMPPPIIWLQNAKRKEHFSESLHSIRKEKYKLRKINPGDNHLKKYQVWKWQKIIPMNFNLITVSSKKFKRENSSRLSKKRKEAPYLCQGCEDSPSVNLVPLLLFLKRQEIHVIWTYFGLKISYWFFWCIFHDPASSNQADPVWAGAKSNNKMGSGVGGRKGNAISNRRFDFMFCA